MDSFGTSGIQLSSPVLGAVAAAESIRSKSRIWPIIAVAGSISAAAIALIHLGNAGLYEGTLISMGAAAVALMLSDLGGFLREPCRNILLCALITLAIAAGIALLWFGTIGIAAVLTDYLDILDLASGILFACAELPVCISAFRCGGHGTVASAALTMSLLAEAICIFSFIAMGGLIY
jgi:hypothetical protein